MPQATTPITIYKIENLVNGKLYIGKTKGTIGKRLGQHWASAKSGKDNPLHKAMRKHGRKSFVINPVLVCEDSMSNYYEHAVLKMHGCYAQTRAGYNVADPLNHFSSISSAKGEDHPMAKLKTQDVIEIRNSLHLSNFEASKKYGISYATVKRIRSGNTWDGVGVSHHFSKYKKDVLTGERHHACVVSDEIRAAIKSDATTNTRDLASRYGLDKSLIPTIRGSQPKIRKARLIEDRIAQHVLDNPDLANSTLSKELSISVATISRIKTGKQFSHLKSMATEKQWESFYERQKKTLGFNF